MVINSDFQITDGPWRNNRAVKQTFIKEIIDLTSGDYEVLLWFGGGVMYEPLAIAIIFGLLFATMLTLGVVPVLYSLFFRVRFKNFQYNPDKTSP